MDIVYIRGLSALTTIGVYDYERKRKQELKIDLRMAFDILAAGTSDDLSDALDYDAISKLTLRYVEGSEHFLIESVAENLSHLLLKEFPIKQLNIKISKPNAVKGADDVGIEIIRP